MALGGLDARLLTVVIKAQNDTKAAFAEVGAQLEGLKRASGGGGFLGSAGGLAVAAGVTAVVAAVGTAAVAVKWASDFQRELTALVTGAGEAANAIPQISKSILTMAGEVGETPVHLAQGLFMIESAGYHGAAGLAVLKAAAEGAKVGNADMMVTADAVTTVMKDYHISATSAADATNFLIGVVKQGKTHMEDLAASLSGILPIASALHIPLEQIGGAMATLTARGVPAANAATYLRFTISALAGETPKGAAALRSIGLTSLEVGNTLTTKGLLPAIQLIEQHLTEKFPKGGAAMFSTLKDITGGTRGLGAALQLTGGNLTDFENATKTVAAQIDGSKGKILGWDAVQRDFGTQMDRSKASVEAMGIKLGQALLPAVTAVAKWFNDNLIPAITRFADFFGQHIAPMIAFAAQTAWPALKQALGTVASAFGDVFTKISDLNDQTDFIRTALITLAVFLSVELPHDILIAAKWFRVLVDSIIFAGVQAFDFGRIVSDVMRGDLPAAIADGKAAFDDLKKNGQQLATSTSDALKTSMQDITKQADDTRRKLGLMYDDTISGNKKAAGAIKATYQDLVTDQARKLALMQKNSDDMAQAPLKAIQAQRQATINAMRITLQGIADAIRNFLMPPVNAPGVKPSGGTNNGTPATHTTHGAKSEGGYIPFAGTAFLHAGEYVLPATVVQTIRSAAPFNTNSPSSSPMAGTVQIVVPVYLGNDKLTQFVKEISLDQLAAAF